MSKVYVVTGCTGYGYRSSKWSVKAFLSRAKAEALQKELEKAFAAAIEYDDEDESILESMRKLDPRVHMEDFEICYFIDEVPLDTE